jgi:biopolymer transport protein ExbD
MPELEDINEPDVTPLINVNLVILVMVLAIASHAARLLPLALPKAEATTYKEMKDARVLQVEEGGTYRLDDRSGLSKDALGQALTELPDGSIVLVSMEPKATYERLIWVLDRMMDPGGPDLQVAFGQAGAAVRAVEPPAGATGEDTGGGDAEPAPETPEGD